MGIIAIVGVCVSRGAKPDAYSHLKSGNYAIRHRDGSVVATALCVKAQ